MGVTRLEIAVQDVAGAVVSAAAGADRLELCAALAATGGLTPSIGLLDAVLAAVPSRVGVHVLVRPRAGSFVYAADELDVQVRDVRAAVAAGAAGVVVGALTPSGAVDLPAVARLVSAADGLEVTFHRAFDTLEAWAAAVDDLVSLGVV
ncbi:copper homeostasis protein CutC, partial [Cellulomonas sp. P5_C6]